MINLFFVALYFSISTLLLSKVLNQKVRLELGLIDAKIETLASIYQRNPDLKQLSYISYVGLILEIILLFFNTKIIIIQIIISSLLRFIPKFYIRITSIMILNIILCLILFLHLFNIYTVPYIF